MMMMMMMKMEVDWGHLDSRPPIQCFHLHRGFWLPHLYVKHIPDRTWPEELCAVAVRKRFPIKAHKLSFHTFQPNKNRQVDTWTKSSVICLIWFCAYVFESNAQYISFLAINEMDLSYSFFLMGFAKNDLKRVLIHYKALRQWLNNHASPQNINTIPKPPKEWELVSVTPTLRSK